MNILTTEIATLVDGKAIPEALALLADRFPGRVVFSTSFGIEDQVITHMIFTNNLPIRVFKLETGRLFRETYYTWNRTVEVYKKKIEAYFPDKRAVKTLMSEKGPARFYESVENRKECCRIRKREPRSEERRVGKTEIST